MRDAEGHIRGVEASPGGLIRATLGSTAAAGAILVLFWLPAEYGIDVTGLGRVTGLTQMGEIKQQLYAEAAADDAAAAAVPAVAASIAGAAQADQEVLARLAGIEAQLAAIADLVGAEAVPVAQPTQAPVVQPAQVAVAAAQTPAHTEPAAIAWRDEVSYTLAPSEGIEIKLVMQEGAVAQFEWTANGAVLNYDTHGDGGGQSISYEQGRGVPEQAGELVASFTGNHGWFWRNRTDAPVTFTLRTRGDYMQMRAP
ncbi:MAG: hypothetical protein LPK02_06525 [Rhodobacterales bacterium]|nr:hypothetical protein [Rhodobacterales bacterium]